MASGRLHTEIMLPFWSLKHCFLMKCDVNAFDKFDDCNELGIYYYGESFSASPGFFIYSLFPCYHPIIASEAAGSTVVCQTINIEVSQYYRDLLRSNPDITVTG